MSVVSKDEKQRSVAEQQAFLRDVNERINEVHERLGVDEPTEFLCECGRPECDERVFISLDTYASVRANPRRFVVVPGHGVPEVEREVDQGDRFAVVETFGVASQVVGALDPRSS